MFYNSSIINTEKEMLITAILEDRNELVSGNAACMNIKQSSNLQEYSKVSIIRPGRSRLLEFENEIVLVF